jgi:NAD(P)-dependent dehydrogenase (short-subunit alcohol dehydrogenase family)
MSGICEGRVVIITGAGRGIGRAHALAFASQGAKVVVNDLGVSLGGEGGGHGAGKAPADEVVDEIKSAGGEAIANGADISNFTQAGELVKQAIDTFGDLHVVVNNAGIVRDRMFVSCSEEEWDLTMKVHLKGHFAVSNNACAYWRNKSKGGDDPDARIINTSSGAGLQGSVGQSAYSTAKGGIATLTLVQATELARYGVTSNAIAPSARTRMTEEVFSEMMAKPEDGFDAMAPENISPLVVWLGSPDSRDVTGRIFEVAGGKISVADGWRQGPEVDKGDRWDPAEVGVAVREVILKAVDPQKVYGS